MKVLICDFEGTSAQWIEQFAIKENLEVVGTINPVSDKKLLAEKSWEYLLVFEGKLRRFFDLLVTFMNIPKKRVIYANDINSWIDNPAAAYALLNPNGGGQIVHRALTFSATKNFHYFVTATTADGLHYLATSKDNFIIRNAYINRQNWAANEMKIFHDLAKKYYDIVDSDGWFLDLGANIGTTGIYFTKKIAPNLKLLAFEPDPENFKLLRTNLILNDAEENSVIENFGLGEVESEMTLYRDKNNPGHNGVYSNDTGVESETVKILPLDNYFDAQNMDAEKIKYIWIDTEGFEPQVLFGMQKILSKNPAPIFMEFNPQYWEKSGYYEKFVELLKKFYAGYVWTPEVKSIDEVEVHPIEQLFEFRNSTAPCGVMGDIFLVHKL